MNTLSNNTGIYIHVPFCRNKCPYCDFYSTVENAATIDSYISAIVSELQTRKRLSEYVNTDITADTVYFGGGTPSVLPPDGFIRILDAVRNNMTLTDDCEITVECNPASFTEELAKAFRECGVNRISLGLQSAIDKERKALGRISGAAGVKNAMELCRENGIDNISLDVMLGITYQTENSLYETLKFCNDNGASHISAYMLKIEKNTPFYRMKSKLKLPNEDEVCDLYENACVRLSEYGYKQYEISNFAKDGLFSRHNLKYWTLADYIGLGPAAHSFFGGRRFYFPRDTKAFINAGKPVFDGYGGDVSEYIMLSLRLTDGIDLKYMAEKYGDEEAKKAVKKAQSYIELHLAEIYNNRLHLTKKGFLLSNTVICGIID